MTTMQSAFVHAKVAGSTQSWEQFQLSYIRDVLTAFHRATLSIASVQPVLMLAEELNPELLDARRV